MPVDSPNRAVCLSPLATVWFSLSGPVPLSAHCPSLIAYNLHLTWCTVSSSSSPVTSSFFSVKTGLDSSRSSGSPTLRPWWLLPLAAVVGAGEADPAWLSPSESVVVGRLEKAEGAAEKALKAEEPGAVFVAAANPLVEAKEENGEADARFVVGAALVKGVEDAGLEDSAAGGCWLVDAGTAARGTLDAEKVEAEKLDLAFGFCASAAGLAVETEPRGDAFEAKAENGDAP